MGKQFAFDSHFDRVETVAFSADDQYIATGSSDRTIRIWRTSDGQLMGTIWGHTSVVKVISFSPQGDYLASATSNGEIKIWDWRTGWEIQSMHADTILLTDLAWSPDGGKLASSSWDGEVKVWDAVTGDELRTLTHEKWVRAVAWSPDGGFLFTGGDELSLKAWEVELGELSAEIPVRDKILSSPLRRRALWLPWPWEAVPPRYSTSKQEKRSFWSSSKPERLRSVGLLMAAIWPVAETN